jgi:hypothetical protein
MELGTHDLVKKSKEQVAQCNILPHTQKARKDGSILYILIRKDIGTNNVYSIFMVPVCLVSEESIENIIPLLLM